MKFSGKRLGWMAGCALVGALGGRLYYANLDAPVDSAPLISPMPNAYDTYIQAFAKLPNKINPTDGKETKALSFAERQTALEQDAEGLRLAAQAQTQMYLAPLPDFSRTDRHLAEFRALARLYAAEGEVRAEIGDKSGAMNSYLSAMTLGGQMPAGGTLIDRLVGIACQAIGRKRIWDAMDDWDAESLKMGAKRLEEILAADVPMAATFGAEKMGAQIEVPRLLNDPQALWQLTHSNQTPDADDEGDKRQPAAWAARINQQMFLFRYPKRSALNAYNPYLDKLIERARKPYARRGPLPGSPRDFVSTMFLPSFLQAELKNDVARTQNALLTLTLALRAYKAEHGAYPANLDELVSENYLTKIPADPFSPDGTAPLRVKFDGDKTLAYSVGPDGTDDGGQEIINYQELNGTPIAPGSRPQYEVREGSKGDIAAGVNLY